MTSVGRRKCSLLHEPFPENRDIAPIQKRCSHSVYDKENDRTIKIHNLDIRVAVLFFYEYC